MTKVSPARGPKAFTGIASAAVLVGMVVSFQTAAAAEEAANALIARPESAVAPKVPVAVAPVAAPAPVAPAVEVAPAAAPAPAPAAPAPEPAPAPAAPAPAPAPDATSGGSGG
jgi:pyruvate dehydrogenase E2 component (dihydrolipoamide acetyltransferase)